MIKRRCPECGKTHYDEKIVCNDCLMVRRIRALERRFHKSVENFDDFEKLEIDKKSKQGRKPAYREPTKCLHCGELFYSFGNKYCCKECGYAHQFKTDNEHKKEWARQRSEPQRVKKQPIIKPPKMTVEQYFENKAKIQFWREPEVKIPLQICIVYAKDAVEFYTAR